MYCTQQINNDVFYVGASDRRLALFENIYPIPRGISYNSYLVMDDKTILLDTCDKSVGTQFLENIDFVLNGRSLDYLVVNHMEPDHCALMPEIVLRHPDVKIVGNAKTFAMIKQFFDFDVDSRAIIVKEGDTLSTGRHTFHFVMAPMVHWPEVMVTYDSTDKYLYAADAFGTFGALNGNIYADEVDFERDWLDDARRYYTNIVGKYGPAVQTLLKKASSLEISAICPLHGPIWRRNCDWFIEKYQRWSTYTPEDKAIVLVYGSIYGNTENTINVLANMLAQKGVKNICIYDASSTHSSIIISESFRCSHLVFASSTYNAGIFPPVETALLDLKAHNMQKRTVALLQNGSWAATSGAQMSKIFEEMKDMTIITPQTSIKSALKKDQLPELEQLAEKIASELR
ncbi:MAG: FprA family A-type flavoprotein [Alphaproteobacteria bacterium]|nr:FprA family A-type flavoprotein [Alphaproteobacteria bacterium]